MKITEGNKFAIYCRVQMLRNYMRQDWFDKCKADWIKATWWNAAKSKMQNGCVFIDWWKVVNLVIKLLNVNQKVAWFNLHLKLFKMPHLRTIQRNTYPHHHHHPQTQGIRLTFITATYVYKNCLPYMCIHRDNRRIYCFC